MTSTYRELAEEAEFQLEAAKNHLEWMTAIARAIARDIAYGGGDIKVLSELAKYLDDTGITSVDSAISNFKQLAKAESAPQNADQQSRGAEIADPTVTLAEFAKGRQIAAADQLGITQQALNTALKLEREILITVNPDGTASGVETKPFPSATRRKRQ